MTEPTHGFRRHPLPDSNDNSKKAAARSQQTCRNRLARTRPGDPTRSCRVRLTLYDIRAAILLFNMLLWQSTTRSRELGQERRRLFQIGGIEPLGGPGVDRCQARIRLAP